MKGVLSIRSNNCPLHSESDNGDNAKTFRVVDRTGSTQVVLVLIIFAMWDNWRLEREGFVKTEHQFVDSVTAS